MSGVVVIKDPPKKHIQSVIDNFSNGKRKESIVEIESLIIDYPLSPLKLLAHHKLEKRCIKEALIIGESMKLIFNLSYMVLSLT